LLENLSANTQAILLLTAPLMLGKREPCADLLKPREYQLFARHLLDNGKKPADLLSPGADDIIAGCATLLDSDRLKRLLGRGFLLGQAVERWHARAIWVVSRADPQYPKRFKSRIKDRAPAILYGCGDIKLLDRGGLAVVGSRHVSDDLTGYAARVGGLTAQAGAAVISGGAKGVDRAAMDGALESDGVVVGVLAEELEREAMARHNREPLRQGRLVFATEYDPCSHFSVGHAMKRNSLIYALADSALVVNCEFNKGGTWAGAVEQLEKFFFVPVFVRSTGERSDGLEALLQKGAMPWPEPGNPQELAAVLRSSETLVPHKRVSISARGSDSPAEELFRKVQEIVLRILAEPKGEEELAALLSVSREQTSQWLHRMLQDGLVVQSDPPARYALRGRVG